MKNITTEYFFSKNALALWTILIVAFVIIFSYVSYTTYLEPSPYNDKKFAAIIILLLLVLFLATTMRQFIIILISLIKNRPALILTHETLTDNINRKTIKWSDIADITDKFQYSGKTSGHFITISLKDSDKNIRIADRGIKCEKQELLTTLIQYHDKYK